MSSSTLPASPSHLQHSSASDPSTIKNAFPEPTLSLAEFDKASLAQEVKAATAGSRKHDIPVELGGGQNKHGKEEDAAAVKLSTARISNKGSTIETDEGTIRIQPFKPAGSRSLRALISFTPRTSHFDLHNPSSQSDPFRGFYSLFWISMFLLVLQTVIRSLAETGYVLSGTFFHLITGDSLVLAASDAVMVGASGVCVLFVKGMVKGWWGYGWRVKTVQHAMQTAYLAVAVRWTFHRDWYWVQAGFLVLHCLSMLMKIHSYIASNGALCEVHSRLGQTQAHLSSLLASRSGGETLALSQAAEEDAHLAHIASEEAAAASGSVTPDHLSSGNGVSIPSTPGMEKAGFITEEKLRQRLNTTSSTSTSSSTGSGPSSPPLPPPDAIGSTANPVQPSFPPVLPPTAAASSSPTQTLPPKSQPRSRPTPHALINHPDYQIRQLAENIDGMTREITSTGPNATRWPENVSAWNFVDYLLVPTLVYEMEYPRTNKIRPGYIFEKICATLGTFSLIYVVTEHFIFPLLPKEGDSFVVTFINLVLPMIINYILIFYIIFECICNGFAELTYFADREFYQDWWNASTWDQFARSWNKPVHTFLLRHVYSSTLNTGKVSRTSATFLTFLLSALCHELVMAVVSKKIRAYLFGMQMAQLPMIAMGRMPIVKRNKALGNVVFWLGLMSGFPLLAIAYLMY